MSCVGYTEPMGDPIRFILCAGMLLGLGMASGDRPGAAESDRAGPPPEPAARMTHYVFITRTEFEFHARDCEALGRPRFKARRRDLGNEYSACVRCSL
jgi:hypothetical protein